MTQDFDLLSQEEAEEIANSSYETLSLEIDEDYSDLISGLFSNEKPVSEDKIMVPEELSENKDYIGDIYGFIRKDSGYHVIFSWDGKEFPEAVKAEKIGSVGKYPNITENINIIMKISME